MHTDSTNVKSAKAAQSEATRAKLVRAGRRLFGKRGFADVGTEEIVRAAGVTRGALYHQFADKRELFAAVFEDTEAELIAEAGRGAAATDDPVEALRGAFEAWLEACSRPAVQRIVLVDAPAVLGWEEWRAIGERHGLGVTMAALRAGMDAGALAPQPLRPLAHVIVGALDEAALYVARAQDTDTARTEMTQVLDRLVDSLRAT
ncbi:MAG TPA: TetR/AcrR family transcriptional regulator [Solirubrobacteraceae bacterium]|nr:TetR/AcrR family transcriptional regulator [Solirubrobacteraceae bacterium]